MSLPLVHTRGGFEEGRIFNASAAAAPPTPLVACARRRRCRFGLTYYVATLTARRPPLPRAQSIMQYNGGCCIAMAGKDCFAIASDRRFGQQQLTVSCDFSKVRPRAPPLPRRSRQPSA